MHTLSVHTDNIVIAQSGLTFLRQATSFYADLFYDPRMSESDDVHVPDGYLVDPPPVHRAKTFYSCEYLVGALLASDSADHALTRISTLLSALLCVPQPPTVSFPNAACGRVRGRRDGGSI